MWTTREAGVPAADDVQLPANDSQGPATVAATAAWVANTAAISISTIVDSINHCVPLDARTHNNSFDHKTLSTSRGGFTG